MEKTSDGTRFSARSISKLNGVNTKWVIEIALVYNGAGVDPQKINAVKQMKDPQNIKQLRLILGLIRFYRNCFEGFKKTAEPPDKLLIKSEKFFLNEACNKH